MTKAQPDTKADSLIHRNLRKAFCVIESEPLPDHLTALLARLKQQDANHETR